MAVEKYKGKKRMTAKQIAIIDCLAEGLTQSETARQLGVDPATVSITFKDPDLKQLYFTKCANLVQGLVPIAIQRLQGILENEKTQPSVQIAAIREVLDRANLQQYIETDEPPESFTLEIKYE